MILPGKLYFDEYELPNGYYKRFNTLGGRSTHERVLKHNIQLAH
jgi:hypothetical protein